jgi:hypothetical protein
MSTKLPTVTVPAHYSFLLCLRDDEIEDTCDSYEVTIIKEPNGDFKVTGPEAHLESFADDICAGDSQSVNAIMATIK